MTKRCFFYIKCVLFVLVLSISGEISATAGGQQDQDGGFGPADANGFMDVPDGISDEELPF